MIRRSRNVVSILSCSRSPRTTIGIDPMMISQPIRASGSERSDLSRSDSTQVRMMFQMSCRK
ncbi:unannotated protein [freshwater metagenome]|uniref:Unannotated protein n=1 Tax=freshwater metagenome TaxID=449393 RepID=A0A6J7GR41_9ZZZZ